MNRFSIDHLADHAVDQGISSLAGARSENTAMMLAYIGAADARRLFVPLGYSTIHEYCMARFRISRDVAFKRITAARLARRFPEIFEAVAEGRLGTTGILMLAPHLEPDTAGERTRRLHGRPVRSQRH